MECKIDPKLPYTDLSTMIRRQRQVNLFFAPSLYLFFFFYWQLSLPSMKTQFNLRVVRHCLNFPLDFMILFSKFT